MRLHNLFAVILLALTFLPGSLEAACSATQRAKMIKQNIPEETISDICGDVEETKVEEKKKETKVLTTKSSKKKSKSEEPEEVAQDPAGWNFQFFGVEFLNAAAYGTDGSKAASLSGYSLEWAGLNPSPGADSALLFSGKYFNVTGSGSYSTTLGYHYFGIGVGYAILSGQSAFGILASYGLAGASSSNDYATASYSGSGTYQELFWMFAGEKMTGKISYYMGGATFDGTSAYVGPSWGLSVGFKL